jgi:methylmalonyl-CoA/ethylmalonyl-CoA epimerase
MTEDPAVAVRRFDHVAIAVWDLAEAVTLYHDLLGAVLIAGGDDDRLRIRTVQLKLPPGSKVELLTPLDETSYLHRYLTKHGPGFHHMTCYVDDVEEAAARLDKSGFETVDTDVSQVHWKETFVRPSSAFGTLLQLASTDLVWDEPVLPDGAGVADILAGRIVWNDVRPTWRTQEKSA